MIRDFPCSADKNGADLLEFDTDIVFPDVHFCAEKMAQFALETKAHSGTEFCMLPFCHTVEAEALGAVINHGDRKNGPRVKDYACRTADDLLNLPPLEFDKGRIAEVLKACKILETEGETVALEITGPLTLLSSLIDPMRIFRAMRKEPEKMNEVFEKIRKNIIAFALEAEKNGVTIISYADPTGGVSIVGPAVMDVMVKNFTVPLLKELDRALKAETLVNLCPKTAFALIDTGCAEVIETECETNVGYGKICKQMRGKTRFVGHTCIKNTSFRTGAKIGVIKLKQE